MTTQYVSYSSRGSGGGGGSGTVTSIGLVAPSIFTVSGSPVTTSGNLTFALANENANTVFAGPSSGSAAAPTFRSLVVADLPTGIPYGNLTLTGSIVNADISSSAAIAVNKLAALTVSRAVASDASGFLVSSATTATELGFVSGVTSAIQTQINAKGTGSVTSVGLTVPTSILGVTGSPITTSGTLALTTTGTSGGIPYFSSTSALSSSAALTASALVLGGGAGASPTVLASLGTTTTVLHGNAAGAPTFGAVALTTDVSGTLPVANGGTGVTSVTTAPAATAFAGWDANKNLFSNNLVESLTSTVTAAGTTTLTVASTYQQVFTGTNIQLVILPVASTLVSGQSFLIINQSTGLVSVETSAGILLVNVVAGASATVTCVNSAGGTGTASWAYSLLATGGAVLPTVQKFTSSSGTYTTPAGVIYIRVRMVGGGGGGAGSSTSFSSNVPGGAGGSTTFGSSLLAAGGGSAGGTIALNSGGGSGGTASLGTGPIGTAVVGSAGGSGGLGATSGIYLPAPSGGTTPFGGGGSGGPANQTVANAPVANSGGGGGAAGAPSAGCAGGAGGAGGFVDAIISAPAGTYAYAVGTGGSAGAAGTGGYAGAAGAAGYIEVTEYYANGAVGTATNVTATSNSTLATLSSPSSVTVPYGVISGSAGTANTTSDANLGTIATVTNTLWYEGNFTAVFNGTGFNSSQSVTVEYTKRGKQVTLTFPEFSAAGATPGNVRIATTTSIPSNLLPAFDQYAVVIVQTGAGVFAASPLTIRSSTNGGFIYFYANPNLSTIFTAAATIGWLGCSITYKAAQ